MENAKVYWRYRIAIIILDLVLSIFFFSIIQISGFSALVRDISLHFSVNFYMSLVVYLGAIGILYYAISFPLNFYGSLVLERKFSLSNRTLGSWMVDESKKCIISALITLFLIEIFYLIARNTGIYWWFLCALFWIIFSIIFARLFPVIIIPMFYKYKILANNELRTKILTLAEKFKIKVLDVFEIDFSKNTKKSNAAVVGLGRTKRVILADNLVNEFTAEEVEVVMAHEMAHYKLGHLWKLLLLGAGSIIVFFFILSAVLVSAAGSLKIKDMFNISLFPVICIAYIIYSTLTMPIHSAISRKLEEDADRTALKMTGLRDPFISLMKKLGQKNLSDENPNKIVEIFIYDHPPIKRRIEMAENFVTHRS